MGGVWETQNKMNKLDHEKFRDGWRDGFLYGSCHVRGPFLTPGKSSRPYERAGLDS